MYQYREVMLGNRKKDKGILVIEFDDPQMKIVGEFLMADGALLGESLLHDMKEVLGGRKPEIKVSGNRCGLHIQKETTIINDLLSDLYHDMTGLEAYTIETSLLKNLLEEWLQVRQEYYAPS